MDLANGLTSSNGIGLTRDLASWYTQVSFFTGGSKADPYALSQIARMSLRAGNVSIVA